LIQASKPRPCPISESNTQRRRSSYASVGWLLPKMPPSRVVMIPALSSRCLMLDAVLSLPPLSSSSPPCLDPRPRAVLRQLHPRGPARRFRALRAAVRSFQQAVAVASRRQHQAARGCCWKERVRPRSSTLCRPRQGR